VHKYDFENMTDILFYTTLHYTTLHIHPHYSSLTSWGRFPRWNRKFESSMAAFRTRNNKLMLARVGFYTSTRRSRVL
jgi:hypothetical protein